MEVEKIKNWWNARKFWEKGVIFGAIISFILPYLTEGILFYSAETLGLGIRFVLLLIVAGIFGLGFKLSERFDSYTIRGTFIGAFIPLFPLFLFLMFFLFSEFSIVDKGIPEGLAVVLIGGLLISLILSILGRLMGFIYQRYMVKN